MPSMLEKKCLEAGLKMTAQRRTLIAVLSEASDHPDVEEIFHRARERDNAISIATTYRTIRLFEEKGILEKIDLGDGRAHYEAATTRHHDHLIDMKTGQVKEFFDPRIEALQKEIAKAHGFKLVGHRMDLYVEPLEKE